MLVLIVAAYAVIAYFQTRMLIRKKYRRDLVLGSLLLLLSLTLTILYASGVPLPDPSDPIAAFFDSIGLRFNID